MTEHHCPEHIDNMTETQRIVAEEEQYKAFLDEQEKPTEEWHAAHPSREKENAHPSMDMELSHSSIREVAGEYEDQYCLADACPSGEDDSDYNYGTCQECKIEK